MKRNRGVIELDPVRINHALWEQIGKHFTQWARKEIFEPLLRELDQPKRALKNANASPVESALRSGQIAYAEGKFKGRFNAAISRQLKSLGARWESRTGTFAIPSTSLPPELRLAIWQSDRYFTEQISRVFGRTTKILPEEFAGKIAVLRIFEKQTFEMDRAFRANVKRIAIQPKITPEQQRRIAQEWTESTERHIRGMLQKRASSMRDEIQKAVQAGKRAKEIGETIVKQYGIAERRIQFIARQEVKLFQTAFSQTKYEAVGVKGYKWQAVAGSPKHPTRPRHHELSEMSRRGKIFEWNDPPITTEPGQPARRNNPGEDFNCLPGSARVGLDCSIEKVFRRWHSGELTTLVSDDGEFLDATANHPILTQRGWTPAKDIQIGDYVFKPQRKSLFIGEVNCENTEPSLEQVFDALSLCSEVASGLLSRSDFHGDAIVNENVDVITIDRELIFNAISSLQEDIRKLSLEHSNSPTPSSGLIQKFFIRWGLGTPNLVSLLNEFDAFIDFHFGHSDFVGHRGASSGVAIESEPSRYDVSGNSVFIGNSKLTHPFLVILHGILVDRESVASSDSASDDLYSVSSEMLGQAICINSELSGDCRQRNVRRQIVPHRISDKRISQWSGHVFNLQTKTGWFLSHGAIVHNCRCVAIPVIRINE